jgi:ribosome-binding factor A
LNESNRRTKRIAQLIRDHVARYLVSQVGDKRLAQVVISDVGVSDDLSIAWLSVRTLTSQGNDVERKQCVKQLQLLAGRLRKSLSSALGLRRVPELRFAFDDGLDAHHRVEEILHEIDTEQTPKT